MLSEKEEIRLGKIARRLQELGIRLPAPLILPSQNRTSAVLSGNTLYLSGHGAALLHEDSVKRRGKVAVDITEEEAQETAKALAILMLATIQHHLGDLDRVAQVIKIVGMINAHPDFERQNIVLNGASDMFYEVFGQTIGQHARSSIGVSGLVDRQPIEIEGIFQVTNLG